jgi:hypothetical protein
MSKEAYIRGSLALAVAELFPPSIRYGVFADDVFAESLFLKKEAKITIKAAGAEFRRDLLYASIRDASTNVDQSSDVTDQSGVKWRVRFCGEGSFINVSISSESTTVNLPHLLVLSNTSDHRVEGIAAVTKTVNLPADDSARWISIASQR